MAKVLILCQNEAERMLIEGCLRDHELRSVKTFKEASRTLTKFQPDLLVARVDQKDRDGMEIVRVLRRSQINLPVVLILPRRGTPLESEAWQLGVRHFVEPPIRYDNLCNAVRAALNESTSKAESGEPPIAEEERKANLSELVNRLNAAMKCPAGQGKVFIRSVITGIGRKTQPRVALRCPVRQAVGLEPHVFYTHIRDICCKDPRKCEAIQQYRKLKRA